MSGENNNSVIMETVDQNLVININNKRPEQKGDAAEDLTNPVSGRSPPSLPFPLSQVCLSA